MTYKARISDEQDIRKLWKLGFNDSDEFMDFYFGERFNFKNTLVLRHGKEMVSSAQVIPFDMKFFDEIINSTYILGVATHPEHRKRGYAGQIINYSIKQQYAEGVLISTLIPQQQYLFDIYKKYGFTEMFNIKETKYKATDVGEPENCKVTCFKKDNNIPVDILVKFHGFYNRVYGRTDCALLKSYDDFIFTIKEFLNFEGDIYLARHSKTNEIGGCGFFLNMGDSQRKIKEFLYDDENYKNAILNSVLKDNGTEEILVTTPENIVAQGTVKPLGMARIINVIEVLKIFARTNKFKISIEVLDELIEDNNGIYLIENQEVCKAANGSLSDYKMDVSQLLDLIIGRGGYGEIFAECFRKPTSYMNLMLN